MLTNNIEWETSIYRPKKMPKQGIPDLMRPGAVVIHYIRAKIAPQIIIKLWNDI